ncbi:6-phosphofructokinase [Dethiosulfatarculus sandiegensis]|uniref:6-phosphofructokinase n=1 Tax=Dethiosulfatarculus sandiegensis TaxID=1429043 RepID=UPI0005CB0477|nr:6-phosphofructokinase [Dethiosulfatarculus sandiegensis]
MAKTIGILTGGGDVPGLNACIKTVVWRAEEMGARVLGIRRGWHGLLHFNPEDDAPQPLHVVELQKTAIRAVDRSGGTFLHTSRTNPALVVPAQFPDFVSEDGYKIKKDQKRDYTGHILNVLEKLGIDLLLPIGGDDTLSYAAHLHQKGVPVISIPKTMDNDVFGTDICIGFSTAVTRSVDFITALRSNVGSHERIGVVELFGRHSGETSLMAAHLAGVDRAVISEVPFDMERLARLLLKDKKSNPSNYSILSISEGAHMRGGEKVQYGSPDAYGHLKLGGIGFVVSEALKKITGERTIYQQVAYLMRSGAPDALDRMVAISFANLAMELLGKNQSGRMVALRHGNYTHVPATTAVEGKKTVDVDELYDKETYRPKVKSMLGKPMFLY